MAEPTDPSNFQLGGVTLKEHCHVCAFFRDQDEEYSVLVPFIADGLRARDKIFYVLDPRVRAIRLEGLQQAGIEVVHAQQIGQLEARGWDEVYLSNSHFEPDKALAFIKEALESGKSQGFHRTRFIAHAEWVLEYRPDVDRYLEFESRVSHLLTEYRDPVI